MMRRKKPRSPHSQLNRMSARWPEFDVEVAGGGQYLVWTGPLRGFQMNYQVSVQWRWQKTGSIPYVFILDPKIAPRSGATFEDIPHLLFNSDAPENSALCLFDPDGREWDNTILIADTTVPWASEWLHHYECWHLDGVWRGANAPGPISVAEIKALSLDRPGQTATKIMSGG